MKPQNDAPVAVTSIAFRMKLKSGATEEYRRRHDTIWPELVSVLRDAGIYDYSIFLDPESLNLFAVLKLAPDHQRDSLPNHPVMKRWWTYMEDLMVAEGDGSDGGDGGDEAEGSDTSDGGDVSDEGKKDSRRSSATHRPKEWPLELMFHMD